MSEIEEDATGTGAPYPPQERFNKDENYAEFARIHGFDIRGELTLVRSSVPDLRDARDPEKIGQALLTHPEKMSILEMAALIEETR